MGAGRAGSEAGARATSNRLLLPELSHAASGQLCGAQGRHRRAHGLARGRGPGRSGGDRCVDAVKCGPIDSIAVLIGVMRSN